MSQTSMECWKATAPRARRRCGPRTTRVGRTLWKGLFLFLAVSIALSWAKNFAATNYNVFDQAVTNGTPRYRLVGNVATYTVRGRSANTAHRRKVSSRRFGSTEPSGAEIRATTNAQPVAAAVRWGINKARDYGAATAGLFAQNGITVDRREIAMGQSDVSVDHMFADNAASGMTIMPVVNAPTGTNPSTYASYIGHFAARYGPGGTFWAGRTDGALAPDAVEIINEPYYLNQENGMTPAAYVALFKAASQAIDTSNPAVKALLAANTRSSSPDDWDQNVVTVGGASLIPLVDGLAMHPYTGVGGTGDPSQPCSPGSFAGQTLMCVPFEEQRFASWGYGSLPVYITEYGYNVTEGSESEQALRVDQATALVKQWGFVRQFDWFQSHDYGVRQQEAWGLIRGVNVTDPASSARPALARYVAAANS
jgi:hypothetical protein